MFKNETSKFCKRPIEAFKGYSEIGTEIDPYFI